MAKVLNRTFWDRNYLLRTAVREAGDKIRAWITVCSAGSSLATSRLNVYGKVPGL
jgi:hypothetical protein